MEESKSFEVDYTLLRFNNLKLYLGIIFWMIVGAGSFVLLILAVDKFCLYFFNINIKSFNVLGLAGLIGVFIPVFVIVKWILPKFEFHTIDFTSEAIIFSKADKVHELLIKDINEVWITCSYQEGNQSDVQIESMRLSTKAVHNSIRFNSRNFFRETSDLYNLINEKLNLSSTKYILEKQSLGNSKRYIRKYIFKE